MAFIFDGFDPANTTPVPDVFFDVLLSQLTGAEVKVLLYIIRRTTGFKKTTDTISFTQFEKGIITKEKKVLDTGTGLSRETISKALAGLEAKGCIKSHKRTSTSGDKDTSAYSVRFKGDVVGKSDYPTWSEKTTTLVGKSDHGSQKSGLPVVGKSDIQLDSNTRNSTQETVRQESIVTSANAGSDAPALFAFQVQNFPLHFYHDFCIHAQDRGINDGLVLIVKNLRDVPADAECQICYKLVHGPHGYYEIGNDAPALIDFTEQKKKRDTEPRIPAVSSHSQADIGNEETVKMPAVKPSQQTIASSGTPDAAQRTIASPGGAVQASIPKRPKGRVTQAKPTITLTAQEQAFWDLWRGVWFNLDIPPDLTETAYGHVKKLAPFITTSEQLTSLIDFTRKDLAASQNIKRKMVQLGNMVHCYAGWKQAQQQPANNISKNGTDLNQYGLQALLQRQEQKAV